MLFSNAEIDDNQRISVMDATAPSYSNLNGMSSNYEFLAEITYSSVVSEINQCDKDSWLTIDLSRLSASSPGMNPISNGHYSNHGIPCPAKATYESLKMKYPCKKCGKFRHWIREHNDEGLLPAHVKSVRNRGPEHYS